MFTNFNALKIIKYISVYFHYVTEVYLQPRADVDGDACNMNMKAT